MVLAAVCRQSRRKLMHKNSTPKGGWTRYLPRYCPTLRLSGFMFYVQSHTRDIPETPLTPYPLDYQLAFLPPTALSNPSPLPLSLHRGLGSDLYRLHRHSHLDSGDSLLTALSAYWRVYQISINLSHLPLGFLKLQGEKKEA